MTKRNIFYLNISLFTLTAILFLSGCERDINTLEPASYPDVPEVFIDGFSAGLNYAAFGGSKVTAFDVDNDVKYKGTASMKIEVPDFEDPLGAYAGGAYFTSAGRNLTGYDALTFWAKASQPANIDIVGIGNDLGQSRNFAAITGLAVNSNWKNFFTSENNATIAKILLGSYYYFIHNQVNWIEESLRVFKNYSILLGESLSDGYGVYLNNKGQFTFSPLENRDIQTIKPEYEDGEARNAKRIEALEDGIILDDYD